MKETHVTIYDVAARAGVSAATASRALAGLKVRGASLEAVERAALELGYVPNEAARSLRVVRTMTVGMVFSRLTSRLGIELLDALAQGLDEQGYSLFIATAGGDEGRYDRLVRRFLERRVDALICVHGHGEGEALSRFLAAGTPAISLINHSGGYQRLPLIAPSISAAAMTCVADLEAWGHRHVAVLRRHAPPHFLNEFAAAAKAGGLQVTEFGEETPEALATALRQAGGPTVLLARQAEAEAVRAHDPAASVIALRDRSLAHADAPALSLLDVDPARIGAAAVEALRLWLDEKTPLHGLQRVDAGLWEDRGSVTRLNA